MSALERYLEWHGTAPIRKIIVSFAPLHRILFPYGIHNLVLERSTTYPTLFQIQFYHYMNPYNQLIQLPRAQKVADYSALKSWIQSSEFLMETLGGVILYPELT